MDDRACRNDVRVVDQETQKSQNTRRADRRDVMDFVEFLGLAWPELDNHGRFVGVDESWSLLQATVSMVQAWRDYLSDERNLAPNTLNRP